MKRTLLASTLLALALSFAAPSMADAQAGNPVGNLDGASCAQISGWSYDPDAPTSGPSCQGGASASCQAVNDCSALDSNACGVYSSECSWNGSSCENRSDFSCSSYGSSEACNPTYRCDWLSCGSAVAGCTDPAATNYNSAATQDNGSCAYGPGGGDSGGQCVSRYRWVNVQAGPTSHETGCASVGAVPVYSSPRGICASGESRPTSGFGYASINYTRGTWGGGNGGGGSQTPFQNGGYRCYVNGQEWDKDNTDVAVAYYCDFGAQFSDSCPADNPPPPPSGDSGGNSEYDWTPQNWDAAWSPLRAIKAVFSFINPIFAPLAALAASSDSNSVQIYVDGSLAATVAADQYRPDVNAVMGVSGNHGFVWATPESLKDGLTHTVRAYGLNVDGSGATAELSASPRTLQCEPTGAPNTSPSAPSLSCPSNGSYTGVSLAVAFTSADGDGDGVRYHIDWDNNGSVDQTVLAGGGYAPSGVQQSASRTFSSPGPKTVRVVAEDEQGGLSAPASCTFTVVAPPIACSDGVDNDGDGLTDHPADPGCLDAADTDETNSGGAAQCVDGIDNDSDGLTDYGSDPGCADVSDTDESNAGPTCTENCDGGGGTGGGTGGPGGGTSQGYTISGTPRLAIQFLSDLAATSQAANLSINPFGGYSQPVTVSVQSIRSAGGADYGATPTYYFGGQEMPSEGMTYSPSSGFYVNQQGLIGTTFAVKMPVKITEKHYVTLVARSGALSSTHVIELDPSSLAPDFREI